MLPVFVRGEHVEAVDQDAATPPLRPSRGLVSRGSAATGQDRPVEGLSRAGPVALGGGLLWHGLRLVHGRRGEEREQLCHRPLHAGREDVDVA